MSAPVVLDPDARVMLTAKGWAFLDARKAKRKRARKAKAKGGRRG